MRLTDVLQLPEKTYTQKGNGVQGKIMAVGDVTQDGKWYNQPISLQGLDNTKCNITHSTQHPDSLLNQSHIGKDSTWRLKWWMNQRQQRQEISGYPETKIQGEGNFLNQPTPAVPYNTPQTPSLPLQQPNAPQGMQMPTTYAYPVTPETQERMARSVGVEAASRVVAAMLSVPSAKIDPLAEMLTISDTMALYISKGVGTADDPQTEPYEQGVCPSCQLLRVDCTCPTQDFVR
jgi:hypothetical protein